MKSIKEKAEEVFQIEEYDSLETELQKRKMRLCYEHGANYVLGEMEKIINHPRIFVKGDKTVEEGMIEAISKLIEQLKEK